MQQPNNDLSLNSFAAEKISPRRKSHSISSFTSNTPQTQSPHMQPTSSPKLVVVRSSYAHHHHHTQAPAPQRPGQGSPRGISPPLPRTTSPILRQVHHDEGEQEFSLEHEWVLWHDGGCVKGQTRTQYESTVRDLGSFSTVQEFWRYWNHVFEGRRFSEGTNLRIFKNGIKPTWEDPANSSGGKWIIQSPKHATGWLTTNVVLAMIGEQLPYSHEICGIVISIRPGNDLVFIWNSKSDPAIISATTEKLMQILPGDRSWSIKYQAHKEALELNERFRASSVPLETVQPCLSSPLLNHGTNEPLPIGARVEAAAEKIEVNWAWGDRSETGFISEAISENESQVESKARTLIWKQRLGLTPTAKSLLRRTASDQRIPTRTSGTLDVASILRSASARPMQMASPSFQIHKRSLSEAMDESENDATSPEIHRRAHSQEISGNSQDPNIPNDKILYSPSVKSAPEPPSKLATDDQMIDSAASSVPDVIDLMDHPKIVPIFRSLIPEKKPDTASTSSTLPPTIKIVSVEKPDSTTHVFTTPTLPVHRPAVVVKLKAVPQNSSEPVTVSNVMITKISTHQATQPAAPAPSGSSARTPHAGTSTVLSATPPPTRKQLSNDGSLKLVTTHSASTDRPTTSPVLAQSAHSASQPPKSSPQVSASPPITHPTTTQPLPATTKVTTTQLSKPAPPASPLVRVAASTTPPSQPATPAGKASPVSAPSPPPTAGPTSPRSHKAHKDPVPVSTDNSLRSTSPPKASVPLPSAPSTSPTSSKRPAAPAPKKDIKRRKPSKGVHSETTIVISPVHVAAILSALLLAVALFWYLRSNRDTSIIKE